MTKPNKERKNQFEHKVLLLVCILGLVRSIFAIVGDLQEAKLPDDFLTDVTFTLLFTLMIANLFTGKTGALSVSIFYLVFLLLLLVAFYNSRGLEGNIEHNIYVGLILIAFTLKDKLPLYFTLLLILGVITSLVLLEINENISGTFRDRHDNDLNFIFASLGVISVMYFAKNLFTRKRNELRSTGKKLKLKMLELQSKTEELSIKKENLESLTLELDSKVNTRTKALKNQKNRREKYLSITLNELSETYEKTILQIDQLNAVGDNRELIQIMISSGEKLKLEMEYLKEKLDGVS